MVKLALGVAGTYTLRVMGRAIANTAGAAGRATVSGTITHSGKRPARKAIKVTQDVEVCGKHAIFDESLTVGKGGGLVNAVVSIEGVADAAVSKHDLLLDQRECVFAPHVMATTRGSKLVVQNSDPILNTPHAYMGRRTLFNVAQPFQGMKYTYKLKKAGVIRFACDVHDWESAYVLVFDHPHFAVTGKDGSFRIPDVPAGTYSVRVWHEKLGEKTSELTVSSGTAELKLEY
jgi:hypothetical protein